MDLGGFLKQEGLEAYLMHTDSHRSSDMFYATGFLAGDAFTYLNTGTETLLVSGMEKGRAEKESRISDVRSSSDYGIKEELKVQKDPESAYCSVLKKLLKEMGLRMIGVPRNFPLYYAECLVRSGFDIRCIRSPIRKIREKKDNNEVQAILRVQHACEKAAAQAMEIIRRARVRDNELIKDHKPLTAEDIRTVIHRSLLDDECEAQDTIVACGPGSADPHWKGSGVLTAHQPIVLDVFPRHSVLRYYCDMSRTVVKGEPEPAIKEMYEAVLAAQQIAIAMIGPGISGNEVHQAVCDHFKDAGFHTDEQEGFIHSTGHSLGLDVHEKPGLGLQEDMLEAGNVVTVEPGLYYRKLGGVRMEDMVLVTAAGCKNLTRFDKNLLL